MKIKIRLGIARNLIGFFLISFFVRRYYHSNLTKGVSFRSEDITSALLRVFISTEGDP